MNLQECYTAIGGNYQDVLSRLRSEKLVRKFVLKFLDDGSYDLLCRSVEEGNYQDAFRASHTIKGVCQNLSFSRLQESSSQLTETLRDGTWSEEAASLLDQVKKNYQETVDAIRALDPQ